MMKYPNTPDFNKLVEEITLYAQLKSEYGAKGISVPLAHAAKALKSATAEVKRLPIDQDLAKREPNNLGRIQALRPAGPRRMWNAFDGDTYGDRLEGALLGRMAGCTLGAPVEFWPVEKMKALAEENGEPFPPTNYWNRVPEPKAKRYQMSRREEYTRAGLHGVPVDDDIAYTLLGLLIAEEHGPEFTTDDVGKAWIKYLPYACTAEEVALDNLKKGVVATRAGAVNNPYCEGCEFLE